MTGQRELTGPDIGPAVSRLRLGAELRVLREARSLRLEDVAARLDVAPSTLSRIETGKAPARTSYVAMMLDIFGVTDTGQRETLAGLARQGHRKNWFADHADLLPKGAGDYLGLEFAATSIRAYALQRVPGLLQTADYAAAACRATRPGLDRSGIEPLAAIQRRRQELLLAEGRELRLILDESALRRVVGTAGTTAGQLRHLAAIAASGPVTVQVVPLAAARTMLSPAFSMLTLGGEPVTAVAWTSGLSGQVTVTTRAQDISHATETFDALTRAALAPDASTRLIGHLAGHFQDTRN